VILIDDLYQSGITMQYVASRLLQAGAASVLSLTIVKSNRDTDNA
jgi:predicted amidophosphoribosyltransferase